MQPARFVPRPAPHWGVPASVPTFGVEITPEGRVRAVAQNPPPIFWIALAVGICCLASARAA